MSLESAAEPDAALRAPAPIDGKDVDFAAALRAAIGATGLALDRIHKRLKDRDIDLSTATLSYWQSGRSVPGRRGSFAALTQLEDVLGVEPGALANLVPRRGAGSRGSGAGLTFEPRIVQGMGAPELIAELGAREQRELERVSEHSIYTFGPDRSLRSRRVRRIIRATAHGIDRTLAAEQLVDESVPAPRLVPLSHCAIGGRSTLMPGRFDIIELLFDRVLAQGDSIMFEYRVDYGPPGPMEMLVEVHNPATLREFVLEIRFDRAAVPIRCESYEYRLPAPQPVGPIRKLELDPSNSILVVRHELPPTQFTVRWFWD